MDYEIWHPAYSGTIVALKPLGPRFTASSKRCGIARLSTNCEEILSCLVLHRFLSSAEEDFHLDLVALPEELFSLGLLEEEVMFVSAEADADALGLDFLLLGLLLLLLLRLLVLELAVVSDLADRRDSEWGDFDEVGFLLPGQTR